MYGHNTITFVYGVGSKTALCTSLICMSRYALDHATQVLAIFSTHIYEIQKI